MYVAENIKTPEDKLVFDIKKFLFPEMSDNDINTIMQSNESKIKALAERLEFIDMLRIIQEEVKNKTAATRSINGNIITETYQCEWLGADFSGGHKDIESLRIYLLLTCIDTIMGQDGYISAFEWIDEQVKKDPGIQINDILNKQEVYNSTYGLGRRFKEAFLKHLDNELQKEWIDSFSLVAINEGGCENRTSKSAWEEKKDHEKMKKISDTLYSIRSQYTHTSKRSFEQSLLCEKSLNKPKFSAVRPLCLIQLLEESIKSIAKNYFKPSI